jgi:hypothetical protein
MSSTRKKNPYPPGDRELARELDDRRLRECLKKVEGAQRQFESALAELSPVIGGLRAHGRGFKVCEAIRNYWYQLDGLRQQLERDGGPMVDYLHLDAEKQRRRESGTT